MILYFSGTGNSEYVAKRIAVITDGEAVDLFDRIKARDYSALTSSDPWVLVAPTYAWRIPRIVHEWFVNTTLNGNRRIYFVMTCGGSVGNAAKYLRESADSKGLDFMGCYPIIMPENYVALFSVPERAEALAIINNAEPEIDKAGALIRDGKPMPQSPPSLADRISSGIVNIAYYPMVVHARKFRVADSCVSCGKCAEVCPLSNVTLENGKPSWGEHCTHCMACICRCPKNAIEYGRHSVGMPRYVCPKKL